jgi:signal transduction histidine kinase/ActR/RegA family two-component response regulator
MRRLPLRRYLFLLVTAAILPLAVLSGIGLTFIFQDARQEALRHGRDVTRALATAVDAELQGSISALQFLASSNALEDGDIAGFYRRAMRGNARRPDWLSVSLARPNGERLMDSRYAPGSAMPPLVETESVAELVRTRGPQIGVLTPGLERRAFAVRIPVMREGEVEYVLSAVVDPESIRRLVDRQSVPADWVIAVFDSKGLRVARSRAHEQYFGTPASDSLRELMAASASSEGDGLTRAMEGDAIFTAFTRLPYGWSVAIGIPEAAVTAMAARSTAIYGAAVALSILAGLLAALWLARHASRSMSELGAAAHALGRGEAPDPLASRIAEMGEVGAAIAESGRQRQAFERERGELLAREQAARAEAERANRQKDQFLAMLAHELRNPLAAITNASNLLDDGRAGSEMQERARNVIRRQARHLARLTDDLLDAARALLGKVALQSRPLDLASVAAQAVRTLAAAGRSDGHRIVEDFQSAWVSGDPVRLDQVVGNLLENAVKYTPAGGTITLSVRREGDSAVLRVADTGVGIPPELAGRVFDLFVQGPRDIDRNQGGLGIGLTLVRRLVELHGGKVEVHSAGEGKGAEFALRLPAIEVPADAAPVPVASRDGASRTVLLVEDNEDARETLQTLLEMIGHRVDSARDGVTGVEKALAIVPDVAIVDIGLPGIDGFEVARRIRAALGDRVLLVALTGYGAEEDRARVLAAGFDAHVTKPADISELQVLLERAGARSPANA